MKFIVLIQGKDSPAHVVMAPSHFDASRVMAAKLGIAPAHVECLLTDEGAIEDVEIEWIGSDAGSPPTRRRQARERTVQGTKAGPWGQWKPA